MTPAGIARLVVPGRPVAKARARRGANGSWYTPRRTAEYEASIAWSVRADPGCRFHDAKVEVFIQLYSRRPLRGDLDNYAKSVLDGLELGQAIENDRQVILLDVRPVIGSEHEQTVVTIRAPEAFRARGRAELRRNGHMG